MSLASPLATSLLSPGLIAMRIMLAMISMIILVIKVLEFNIILIHLQEYGRQVKTIDFQFSINLVLKCALSGSDTFEHGCINLDFHVVL